MQEYIPYIIALLLAAVIAKFFFGGNGDSQQPRRPSSSSSSQSSQPSQPSQSSSTKPSSSGSEIDAGSVDELAEGGMKEVEVGDNKVLVVKQKGEVYCVGNKCSHYGAPLAKGALGDGRIRCPWHGACFSLKTGDIEDYPCVDAIPSYPTKVVNGRILVSVDAQKAAQSKRVPSKKNPTPDNKVFVILGAGPSGLTAAETLRQEGFGGRVILVGKEKHLPYDRPKLSKTMNSPVDKILLRSPEFFAENKIETVLGVEAKELNPSAKTVVLSDGQTIKFDGLVIATGGNPRKLPSPGFDLGNIFQLRVPEEAASILSLVNGKKVVIVGTSFIGMEAASCIVDKAASVIAIGMETVPFERVLGTKIGAALQKLHEDKKVQFRLKKVVKEFQGVDGKVSKVVLDDGEELEADLCIIGAGIVPATDFVKPDTGIKIERDRSIVVNEYLQAADGIYAVGDLARYPFHMLHNELVRVEHYGMSQYHGKIAALNLLGKKVPVTNIPYFWTTQYGKRINYAGHALSYDDVIIDGSVDELKFVAYFVKGNDVLAVASMNRDPIVSQAAELMTSGKMLTATQIKGGVFLK